MNRKGKKLKDKKKDMLGGNDIEGIKIFTWAVFSAVTTHSKPSCSSLRNGDVAISFTTALKLPKLYSLPILIPCIIRWMVRRRREEVEVEEEEVEEEVEVEEVEEEEKKKKK